MKLVKNYPTKRQPKGKMYAEYMRIEVEKGNISKADAKFWLKMNVGGKINPGYTLIRFSARDHRTANKSIPLYS